MYIALAAFGWAITVIFEKHHLLKYFKSIDLVLLRAPFFISFFVIYYLYNKEFNKKLNEISIKLLLILIFTMISGCIALFCFYKLVRYNKQQSRVNLFHSREVFKCSHSHKL